MSYWDKLKIIGENGIVDELRSGDRKGALRVLLGESKDKVAKDWRVRLSLAPSATYLYNDSNNLLLKPLKDTNGVVFPYTPNITMAYEANYNSTSPVHSNYPIHTFNNSSVSDISISGEFTAQTPTEAKYLLAAMQFFRASTKMFWGNDPQAGTPPPILYLNGYGTHFFPNVPVVIKSFTNDLPEDVDYVSAYIDDPKSPGTDTTSGTRTLTRIPSSIRMSITCVPVYSRDKIGRFTHEEFAEGSLVKGTAGSPGGFV